MKKTELLEERSKIDLAGQGDVSVTGSFLYPENFVPGEGTAVIIAHGAGRDMDSPFMRSLAEGLSSEGCLTLRFNFLYKELGKKVPDPPKKLEAAWTAAYRFLALHPVWAPRKIYLAGKSLGGRIASVLAARNELPAEGLIFYGYPLHAPGRTDKLRDAHLPAIRMPMLFFAGTRDPLCNLDILKSVLGRLETPWDLEVVEGGEHSFNVLKKLGIPQPEIYRSMAKKTVHWIERH